jgi:hypothetical protein
LLYVPVLYAPRHLQLLSLQVGNRQKDTLAKLQAFTSKLRASTQKEQQDRAAAAAQADKQQQDEAVAKAAAAAAQQQEAPAQAANGAGGQGEDAAYDGKVGPS